MEDLSHRLAWLAGIIDGEGAITYWLDAHYQRKDGKTNKSVRARVAIGNTNHSLIDEIMQIANEIGVSHHLIFQSRRSNPRSKPCWYVYFSGAKRVRGVLNSVLPFLISKRKQADLILAVLDHRSSTRRGRHKNAGQILLKDDAWLSGQLAELSSLNRRGVE